MILILSTLFHWYELRKTLPKEAMIENISVFILDDDLYFGRCMQRNLQNVCREVRYFKTKRNFLKAIEHEPEVVILDHHINSDIGLHVLDEINKRGIETYVLYVSSQDNVHITLEAYRKGAIGYFEKNKSTFSQVLKAINWMGTATNDFKHPLNKEEFKKVILGF